MGMQIRKNVYAQESGQVLVQVAVMMVVLLGFVALAVDGGNVYAERRRMQNAADAGALAGARELCLIDDEVAAIDKATEYMTTNGVAAVNAGDVTVDVNVVNTTARKSADTFFAGILGFPTITVEAEAAAACGAATSACGLFPVAFEIDSFINDLACGDTFLVWDSENENQQITCEIEDEERPICDCYDCDVDPKDGTDDFVVLTSVSRGWLDYSDIIEDPYVDTCPNSAGCGSNELRCRIEEDSGARITLPACIPGINGVRAAMRAPVNSRRGEPISIALFDDIGTCTTGSTCAAQPEDTFHVTKFGCTTIEEGWVQNYRLDPRPEFEDTYDRQMSSVIFVSKRCDGNCVTSCGSTDGTVAQPWELKAVSLIR